MFALLLGNWRLIGWTLAGLAILASAGVMIGKYNDRIRKPLQQEIRLLQDEKKANEKRAAEMLAVREKENADLAEKWRQYARKSDDDYEAKIAGLRAAGSSGLRILTAASGCPAGQATERSPEAPAIAAPKSGVGNAPREFVLGEVEVAQVLQWYAYGMSCHAFVNGK